MPIKNISTDSPAGSQHRSRRGILLLDPYIFTSLALTAEMEARGYTVIHTATARHALAAVHKARPDVAILDLTLPRKEGSLLMEQLLELFPELPCVALVRDAEEGTRALEGGATWYLELPYRPDHIVTIVGAALAHQDLLHGQAREHPVGTS